MSEQAGRYQRSAGGMVGAMVVLVVLLVAWVAIQSLVKDQPDSAVRTVDYAQVVAPARGLRPRSPLSYSLASAAR